MKLKLKIPARQDLDKRERQATTLRRFETDLTDKVLLISWTRYVVVHACNPSYLGGDGRI
jgi:hypothetical protein